MEEPKVRFKRDDGSSYPAWNEVVLGDIATRVSRKNTNGETDRPLTIASIEGYDEVKKMKQVLQISTFKKEGDI